jgi:hypothetical protein
VRQEIFAVVQPGDFGQVMRRTEHHIGQQQQFEWHQIGEAERRAHQTEMDNVETGHGRLLTPSARYA